MAYNKDFETDSPIVTVLASAALVRTRANFGSRLKRLLTHNKQGQIISLDVPSEEKIKAEEISLFSPKQRPVVLGVVIQGG